MNMERRRAESIKKAILSQLRWDHSIDARDINVEVVNDKVVLTGTVPAYPDKWEAEQDVYIVDGVSSVENDLRVRPGSIGMPDDDQIRLRVESILEWNHDIDASKIKVSVDHGVVTLSGTADSYWQKEKARDLASNIGGVIEIKNDLKVQPGNPVSDEAIRKDILDALDRSTVDTSQINVSVKDCTVILNGTVNSYDDFRDAEEIAEFTAGVCHVQNDLVI